MTNYFYTLTMTMFSTFKNDLFTFKTRVDINKDLLRVPTDECKTSYRHQTSRGLTLNLYVDDLYSRFSLLS